MTRSSRARVECRRGRPSRAYGGDPDQHVVEVSIALQAAWGLSERKAIDLALAVLQGGWEPPTKVPRGTKAAKAGVLVGNALDGWKSFASRNADIRRKLKLGKLRPDVAVILAHARLLHFIRSRKVRG